jgi:hypothetical protein
MLFHCNKRLAYTGDNVPLITLASQGQNFKANGETWAEFSNLEVALNMQYTKMA